MQKISKKLLFFIIVIIVPILLFVVIYIVNLQNHFLEIILLNPQEYNISEKEKWFEKHKESYIELGSISGVVTKSFEIDGFLIFEVLLSSPIEHSVYLVMQIPDEVSLQNSMNINPIAIYYSTKMKDSRTVDYMKLSNSDTLTSQVLSISELKTLIETQKYFSFNVIVKYSADRITSPRCFGDTDYFCRHLVLMNDSQNLQIDGKNIYFVKRILDPLN